MNYDLEMSKQMSNLKEGDSLLLHACCAPCSSSVLERLGNFFNITIQILLIRWNIKKE